MNTGKKQLVSMDDRLVVNDKVLTLRGSFDCAFCPGVVGSYTSETAEALVHTIPICQMFENLEVDDFMHESAKKKGMVPDDEGEN